MKVSNYKGFEINVNREKCLAGYDLIYYSIYRLSDGLEVTSGFDDNYVTVRNVLQDMKDFIDNPEAFNDLLEG